MFSAVIAAIYTVLTLLLAPISYGQIQVRVSESLTLLPFLSSYSIWGVFWVALFLI
ncbi:QueT transporter family protein [Clostridium botulinum]|nr:QueT transporter family protein [Clostridium botulinum]MCS4517077.1 QueT transporter family protein [Clostridium botulinum]